jgi:bifunctional NMN adenylyltransferase/nudix hydrolase
MKQYALFIGRFQPFHLAHFELLKLAFRQAAKVIIILGSARTACNIKNPWTAIEREQMIRLSLSPAQNKRLSCIHMRDYLYNDNLWLADLQQKIFEVTEGSTDIVLVGHEHDRSSYYLRLFPQWELCAVKNIDKHLHATDIRYSYFCNGEEWKEHVPSTVLSFLDSFSKTEKYIDLVKEQEYLDKYKAGWDKAPFPPTFNTVDSVVIKSGHVLVVRRKGYPGKGLIALPGGFLNQHEKIMDGMLRELKKETAIKVSKEELELNIADNHVFDHPQRSSRGRTITHAFLINLKAGPLPQVKGSDDADKAWWMSLNDYYTREAEFFEDHFHIISYFCQKF